MLFWIFSEMWNGCIEPQKRCESVLCGPSAVVGIFGESVCCPTECVQSIGTTDKNN